MSALRTPIVVLVLVVATLTAFWPVLDNGFIDFDDPRYITEHARVQEGLSVEGIVWAFETMDVHNWHPLTWISYMADVELFGLDPRGHHAVSLGIHTANAVLLFLVLRSMTGAFWCSALAAFLLAVHPLRVESVAWAAERKDVLSMFFLLSTIGAYARYARRPDVLRYLAVLLFFALGLLSKPMLVTLPAVLLLLDVWPLDRLEIYRSPVADRFPWQRVKERAPRLVAEKMPMFAMVAASSAMTLYAQRQVLQSTELFSPAGRVANAALAYVRYIGLELWPSKLSIFYPHPFDDTSAWAVALASGALVAATVLVLIGWRRPYLAVGWLWYLGTLIPVIGLVQVGVQSIADRYSYIPSIGLSLLAIWGTAEFVGRSRSARSMVAVASVAVLALLVLQTREQTRVWKDSVTLYRHAVEVTPDSRWAEFNLGMSLTNRGDHEEALQHFREAVRLKPKDRESWLQIGVLLERQGHAPGSIEAFSRAARIQSGDARASIHLGRVLAAQGRHTEAERVVAAALERWPQNPDLRLRMGVLLLARSEFRGAIAHLRRAIDVRPGFSQAHNNLGVAYASTGNLPAAEAEFEAAVRADPGAVQARQNLERARAMRAETANPLAPPPR